MTEQGAPEGQPPKKYLELDLDDLSKGPNPGDSSEFVELEQGSGGFFSRINTRFQSLLESSRGSQQRREPASEAGESPHVTADDLAIRRAKNVKAQRMIVPEGVIIDGSMTSGSETEIGGRVEGNVTVEGRLYLGPSALITGNVRATACKVEGLVEGKMECSDELELVRSGRLNADVVAGKKMILAGQVFGNVLTGGSVYILSTAKVTGDIRAKSVVIEEGATFNGRCTMRPAAQRSEK